MKHLTWIAAAALLPATPAAAQSYDDLFVFGDSLVDSGNARAARLAAGGADPAPPSQGYFEGRFSNGPNFADYLSSDLFGRPATASAFGGLNFSVGGAQAAEVAGDASPSFLEQIAAFDLSGRTIGADSLVLITLGGNDVRREVSLVATQPGYVPSFTSTIAAMTTGLTQLVDRGARNIIVTGLPDIGQIPAVTLLGSSTLNAAATGLSFNLNQAFAALTGQLSTQTGANIGFFDLFAAQRTIYADPAGFGLPATLDTRRACLDVAGAAPGCANFVYFDRIHPTTGVHRAIADGLTAQAQAAVPEPASWAMMIGGFAATGIMLRRRRQPVRLAA